MHFHVIVLLIHLVLKLYIRVDMNVLFGTESDIKLRKWNINCIRNLAAYLRPQHTAAKKYQTRDFPLGCIEVSRW